jgi:hypothetical protein
MRNVSSALLAKAFGTAQASAHNNAAVPSHSLAIIA